HLVSKLCHVCIKHVRHEIAMAVQHFINAKKMVSHIAQIREGVRLNTGKVARRERLHNVSQRPNEPAQPRHVMLHAENYFESISFRPANDSILQSVNNVIQTNREAGNSHPPIRQVGCKANNRILAPAHDDCVRSAREREREYYPRADNVETY